MFRHLILATLVAVLPMQELAVLRIKVTLAAGDMVLELTAANAQIGSAAADAIDTGAGLLSQARDSVVAIWTPGSRASGFLVNVTGVIATNQRAIGDASSVEVQLSPSLKV